MPSDLFQHLENRSSQLLAKFIEPIIESENNSLANGDPFPDPDYDSIAAFRLLFHAELEGYFENKALRMIDTFDADFKLDQINTKNFSALFFLYISNRGGLTVAGPAVSRSQLKQIAQDTLGFARSFINNNNGIKEASIQMLSAFMGIFPDELDEVLVTELNQYGKKRGDVAHDSWARKMDTFDSAVIEKGRLTKILGLIQVIYES